MPLYGNGAWALFGVISPNSIALGHTTSNLLEAITFLQQICRLKNLVSVKDRFTPFDSENSTCTALRGHLSDG